MRVVRRAIDEAQDGHWIEEDQIGKQRGIAGQISDWLSNTEVPYVGMWTNAKGLLQRAENDFLSGNVRGGLSYAQSGLTSLREAKVAWRKYMTASMAGAERTIQDLQTIEHLSAALVIATGTGALASVAFAAAAGGAGAAAAGAAGAAGGTLVGAAAGTGVASLGDTRLSEVTRGTLRASIDTGLAGNLRLAANGLGGEICGVVEVMKNMPTQIFELPGALLRLGSWLSRAFSDPDRSVSDLQELPAQLNALTDLSWLERLPPDRQAVAIGTLFGRIEALLIQLEIGKATGSAGKQLAGDLKTMTLPAPALQTAFGPQFEAAFDVASATKVGLAQMAAVAAKGGPAVGAIAAMATARQLAASAGGSGGGEPDPQSGSGKGQPRERTAPKGEPHLYEAGDTSSYGRAKGRGAEPGLERHELWLVKYLKEKRLISERGAGAIGDENSIMMLPKETHRLVSMFQRMYKLYDPAVVAKMPGRELVAKSAACLLLAGVDEKLVWDFVDDAMEQMPAIASKDWVKP